MFRNTKLNPGVNTDSNTQTNVEETHFTILTTLYWFDHFQIIHQKVKKAEDLTDFNVIWHVWIIILTNLYAFISCYTNAHTFGLKWLCLLRYLSYRQIKINQRWSLVSHGTQTAGESPVFVWPIYPPRPPPYVDFCGLSLQKYL